RMVYDTEILSLRDANEPLAKLGDVPSLLKAETMPEKALNIIDTATKRVQSSLGIENADPLREPIATLLLSRYSVSESKSMGEPTQPVR
ncbi:MAG: hypothetical protein AAF125_10820, partial [Chloroflexota bacterium]